MYIVQRSEASIGRIRELWQTVERKTTDEVRLQDVQQYISTPYRVFSSEKRSGAAVQRQRPALRSPHPLSVIRGAVISYPKHHIHSSTANPPSPLHHNARSLWSPLITARDAFTADTGKISQDIANLPLDKEAMQSAPYPTSPATFPRIYCILSSSCSCSRRPHRLPNKP